MSALLLFLTTAWGLTAAGRQLAGWLRLPEWATGLERNLIGFALGLGVFAYAMMLLGLAHGFYPAAAATLLVALYLVGVREHGRMLGQLRARLASGFSSAPSGWAAAALFALFSLVALSGVYAPPTLTEWDSVAYHLADPKLYAQAHRIYDLPWEDHSNFAFNLEMCYTFGLLFHSVPLAKFFHFACAVGLVCAVYRLGERLFSARVGLWGALLLISCPIVVWEAGTAYVDLAVAFYATLTLLALAHGIQEKSDAWLRLSAVLMGLTLSTKGTALGVLGLLAAGLFVWRLTQRQGLGRSIGLTALWGVVALAVGSPWYIKSFVCTGNPVYPFFYSIWGGRGWNAADAGAYDAWNAAFGVGHRPVDALLAPWNLLMNLLPGHPITKPKQAFNDYQTPLMTLTPVLTAALFFPVFLIRRVPTVVKVLACYALASLLLWFVTAQHVRYLLPLLPVLCLLAAWALDLAWTQRTAAGRALTALAACSVLFSAYVGVQLLAKQAPVAFGGASRERFIARGDPAYPAMEFINTRLPANAKVVFYGNPLGFYCDKQYLWGELGHSTYVTDGDDQSPEQLLRRLQALGVTHALVNTANFAFHAKSTTYPGSVYTLTAGAGPPLFGDLSDPRRHIFVFALPRSAPAAH